MLPHVSSRARAARGHYDQPYAMLRSHRRPRGISAWYAMMAPLRYAWLLLFSLGMPADAAQKLCEHDVINYGKPLYIRTNGQRGDGQRADSNRGPRNFTADRSLFSHARRRPHHVRDRRQDEPLSRRFEF